MHTDETIAAIASSHDVGGLRGIIRVSGDRAFDSIRAFFVAHHPNDLRTIRHATRIDGTLEIPEFGRIACALYVWPDHRSYTQQPTIELHTCGTLPVLERILTLTCQSGARLARPGEFTLRAFLSGRMDLTQAEAVLGVIDAASDREVQVALRQLAGGLSQPLQQLRDTLLNLVADLEAGLDFVDEDIEFVSQEQVLRELDRARETIEQTRERISLRSVGGTLPRVVLRGEPNAGKSSLWNALVTDGQAIVDENAGTTRDYLVGTVDHELGRFELVDTAGVESKNCSLQASMHAAGETQTESAHLVLFCLDASQARSDWEQTQLQALNDRTLVVFTKSDLLKESLAVVAGVEGISVSQRDASQLDRLVSTCVERLGTLAQESSIVSNTGIRCRESLRMAAECLTRAVHLADSSAGDELVASEVRTALDELGLVVGAIYNDDILDRVFSRFCIGK